MRLLSEILLQIFLQSPSGLGGIEGLSMSALTDSFPLSHINNHLLSTYPVFKAIFSPDGTNVVCIKVKVTVTPSNPVTQ